MCLCRDMDLKLADLLFVIHACFVLHNFCETMKEEVPQSRIDIAKAYDEEFQPPIDNTYNSVNNNLTAGKNTRKIFMKFFE